MEGSKVRFSVVGNWRCRRRRHAASSIGRPGSPSQRKRAWARRRRLSALARADRRRRRARSRSPRRVRKASARARERLVLERSTAPRAAAATARSICCSRGSRGSAASISAAIEPAVARAPRGSARAPSRSARACPRRSVGEALVVERADLDQALDRRPRPPPARSRARRSHSRSSRDRALLVR